MSHQVVLAELAAEQWGLLTAAQAAEHGVSNQSLAHLHHAGALERLAHGVYRLTGAPGDELDELRGAWLGLAPRLTASDRLRHPDDVVSYRSAARVHGLGDLEADRHEFTVDRRRTSRRTDIRFHRGHLAERDWRPVNGLPTTTIPKTIADLASVNTDGGHLAGVVRDAITAQGIDADVITEVLRPHAHRYGVKLGDGTGLVARFLEEAGIPKATRQAVDLLTTRQAVDLLTKNAAGLMNVSAEARAELIEQLVQKMAPNVAEVTELIAAQWAPFTKELIQSIIRQVPPTDGALREAITKALLTAPPSATTAAG
ncbi:type IV toxin-antitoxin system AbiEi family antitoxin domain-containing protein [Kribbella catacumbae]|uniref:type IV toxin-antitoxin system AbiEi family antitoxin domain-containing protein n=1 Tax=Kribbella catacumbae TaxID=460086 RepID=UPI00039BF875|nr:type IV toxin-antitoxin system AbiEi family antitoxin domain-containing protein [Kribbella catacumbae]